MNASAEELLKAQFSNEDANRIAGRITSWRLLAPYIGLDKVDEDEICKESSMKDQKIKMMQVWRQKHNGNATYLQFVRGCEQASRRDLAIAVYDLVKNPAPSEQNLTARNSRLDQVPTLPELFIFTGKSGKRYRVLDRIGPFWEELAFALNFESYVTETIKKSAMYQVNDCCRNLIQKWLQGYQSARGPVTWETLLSAMNDVVNLTVLTAELREEL